MTGTKTIHKTKNIFYIVYSDVFVTVLRFVIFFRYQASALVNKGVMCALRDDHERAKELFLEAVGVEADCLMAIHNLGTVYILQPTVLVSVSISLLCVQGLVNKKLGRFEEAYQAFDKLSSIGNNAYLPNSWSRFHMADILLKKGRAEDAKQHLDCLSNICDGGDPRQNKKTELHYTNITKSLFFYIFHRVIA